MCGHDEYQLFCQVHEIILCVECQLQDHMTCGKDSVKTLKKAGESMVTRLEEINQQCLENF